MKKIYSFLMCAAVALGAHATTFTFTSDNDLTQTKDGITVKIEIGEGLSAPTYNTNNGEMRLYAQNTITVSGQEISKITMDFSKQGSKDYSPLTASDGNLVSGGTSTSNTDIVTDTWTGSEKTVTFTLGKGQRVIYTLTVNGTGGSGEDPTEPATPPGLDPDFEYPEPTLISVPAKTVQGDAYSFVMSNIEVSTTKGAITGEYFSVHAGFKMTFTATQPIKGLVINGFVKKDFEATADHGDISYLSPADDKSADPVVVITDIDSKSVTLSCVKQLRCYTVEIYFDENPDATIGGGASGETVLLTFDSAEAIYESEYSEQIGEPNYTIFLFNEESYDWPYFCLDIYPADKDNPAGTYSFDDYSLGDYTYYVYGAGDDDYTFAEDGTVNISKEGDVYTITGTVTCDNGTTYTLSYKGVMEMYTDDEYYGDESGVKQVVEESQRGCDDKTYDLQGRRVSGEYRGIIVRNGKKYVSR